MIAFVRWLIWNLRGRPKVSYPGYNYGCCGKWVDELISVPAYLSEDRQMDTWGLCKTCAEKKP